MSLFDDLVRDDSSPAAYGEDSFTFLNRADGTVWARVRDTLDSWFAEYPRGHAADIRGRFRGKRPGAHWAPGGSFTCIVSLPNWDTRSMFIRTFPTAQDNPTFGSIAEPSGCTWRPQSSSQGWSTNSVMRSARAGS